VTPALGRLLGPRPGAVAVLATVVRVAAALVLMPIGVAKFADHAHEASDFARYGIPLPEVAVWVSGTVEVVAAVCLLLGLLTRPAAALVAANLVVAIATAGVMEGGSFHLGVGPALLAAMVFLLWAGGGVWSVDAHVWEGARPTPGASLR
jgi:putative oxidoreductase